MSECTVFPGSGGENHIAYAAWAPKSQATHNKLPPLDPGVEQLIDLTVPDKPGNGNIVISNPASLHGSCFVTKRGDSTPIANTTIKGEVTCQVWYTVGSDSPGKARMDAGDYVMHYTIDAGQAGSGLQCTCDFRTPR